jgi:nucleoside-diphosphate-sugar epimerase
VAELAKKYTHFTVDDVTIGPGKIVPRCEALDISRSTEELGYRPRYDLEEGIETYADWLGKMRRN